MRFITSEIAALVVIEFHASRKRLRGPFVQARAGCEILELFRPARWF
jgi:hypothetical protein